MAARRSALAAALRTFAVLLIAAGIPPWQASGLAPAQEGEAARAAARCGACGRVADDGGEASESTAGDRLRLHRGRRVALCSPACMAAWEANHEQLFAGQQARGALFDESATAAPDEGSLFSGWFWFGGYVVVGLLAGAGAAYGALSKGLAPLPWLLGGLAFNVFALLSLWRTPRGDLSTVPGGIPSGLGKIPLTHAPVACPECGGMNHPNARACVGCGAARAAASSESERALRRSSS